MAILGKCKLRNAVPRHPCPDLLKSCNHRLLHASPNHRPWIAIGFAPSPSVRLQRNPLPGWQSGNLRGGDWSKKTLTSACKGFWNGVKCSENRSSPTACKAPFPRRHPSPPGAMHFSSQAHNPPFLAPERFTKKSDSPTHRSLSSPVLPTISCRLSHMLDGNLVCLVNNHC